jgi:hypothetical protein
MLRATSVISMTTNSSILRAIDLTCELDMIVSPLVNKLSMRLTILGARQQERKLTNCRVCYCFRNVNSCLSRKCSRLSLED